MVNIIFDLDGTLIDSRPRLYSLFQQLVPASKLSHESYWAFKREKISNEMILARKFGWDAIAIERFVADWMEYIEAPEYLTLDKNFPGIHAALERLETQARLHVCTARQHRQPAVDQLDHLRLLPYFKSVMVTEKSHTKKDLIRSLPDLGREDWIIGDTGKDIQVGQEVGIRTCAVLSGFLSEKVLKSYKPEVILFSAADFIL